MMGSSLLSMGPGALPFAALTGRVRVRVFSTFYVLLWGDGVRILAGYGRKLV
jgi:hypothetical protein